MIESELMDEKVDLGTQLQKDNSLHIMDNADALINNKGEFNWSIVNLLSMYENMRIILISRNEIKFESVEGIKSLFMIKHMPPLTNEEACDLIQKNCERDLTHDLKLGKDTQNIGEYLTTDTNFI